MVWPLKNDNPLEFFVGDREANFEIFLHMTRPLMGYPPFPGSILVGSKSYIEHLKSIPGGPVKRRKIKENRDGYQPPESSVPCRGVLEAENEDIEPKNIYFRKISTE